MRVFHVYGGVPMNVRSVPHPEIASIRNERHFPLKSEADLFERRNRFGFYVDGHSAVVTEEDSSPTLPTANEALLRVN